MSRNSRTLVLVAVLILVVLAWLFPRPTGADVPAAASPIPSSEFEPVRSSGPVTSGQDRIGPAAPPASSSLTTPERKPAPSPSLRAVPRLAAVLRTAGDRKGSPAGPPQSSVTGIASWYDYVPGGAAAGPALRTALGPGWRGTRVTVCAAACVHVTLSDRSGVPTVIDLDSRSFAALAPLSQGIVKVEVSW